MAQIASITIALVFVPIGARADDPPRPVTVAPSTLELHLLPTLRLGEPSNADRSLSDVESFSALRLSLLSGIFPIGRSLDSDCVNHAEEDGNMVHGMDLQRALFLRMTSKLTLHAFSSTGCVGDSGGGGGFTFVEPLLHNLWLVVSGGAYAVPAVGNIPARVTSDVRVDVVMKRKNGNTLTLGLGAGTRSQGHTPSTLGGLHFGGTF